MSFNPAQLAALQAKYSSATARQKADAGPKAADGVSAFQDTFTSIAASMELTMTQRFLDSALADGRDDSGGSSGAGDFGFGDLNANMLMTLSKLQQYEEATKTATQGAQPEQAPQPAQPAPSTAADTLGQALDTARASAAQSARPAEPAATPEPTPEDDSLTTMIREALGELSSRFESGRDGAAAVGYDRVGGTSYGIFQLSSKMGSLGDFVDFLSEKAPLLASKLKAAGPADTGSREGDMPAAWKEIAESFPTLFEHLQRDFITKSHYEPAMRMIAEATGVDMASLPKAAREVLFSTAVQHGPTGAASIFGSALDDVNLDADDGIGSLIEKVYAMRGTQFGSSTERVRQAVLSRFENEKAMAIAMLSGDDSLLA
jgi:hypothetical protein